MRSGVWPFGIPVLGIECAGTVEQDPSGRLAQGATVVALVGGMARTRNQEREPLLRELGADRVLIDDGALAGRIEPVDAVLDLVGNATLRDSLACVRPKGRVCLAGFFGGLDPVPDFNPLSDLPSGVELSTFASAFVLGEPAYPVTGVPLQEIVARWRRTRPRASSSCASRVRRSLVGRTGMLQRALRAGRPGGGSRPSPNRRPCA
jgi:NADPH:quinone reductase-like Zn-dependent oxidoreductase